MNYSCRLFNPASDKEVIKDLWIRNMNLVSPMRFMWLYEYSTPVADVYTWLLYRDDVPCGCISILKRNLVYRDQNISCGIAIDILVDKAQRTVFPAITLIRSALEGAKELGFQILLSFPNKMAQPIFLRCGFQKVCMPYRFSRIINYQTKLNNILNSSLLTKLLSLVIKNFERALLDSLHRIPFRKIEEGHTFYVEKDITDYIPDQFHLVKVPGYNEWRYETNPLRKYDSYCIKMNSVSGSVIYYMESGTAIIEDIQCTNPKWVGLLLYMFVRYLRKSQVNSISLYAVMGSYLSYQLSTAGFIRRMSDRYLLGIDLISSGLVQKLKDNIMLFDGDMDI